jgi:Domain of unknown function (DUF1942)
VKFTNALAAAAAVAAAGSIGIVVGAPTAAADATTQTLGSQGKLVDGAGNVVQGWTISGLKPSSDVIPHQVNGTLWEATATDEAVQGGATPIVSNLNARARDGETYRVLFGAATPQGVNPATLAQGEKTTGKVYFDVTGAAPDSVVYNTGSQDVLVWVGSPTTSQGGSNWKPAQSGSGASSSAAPATAATPGAATGAVPAAPAADGTVTPGTAATGGVPGTPLSTGSQGTPLPTGSTGTPVPAGNTPVPAGSQGTPLPAGEGAPQPASVGTAPVSGGTPASAGTPAGAEAPAAAPAAAPAVAPAPAGSQGTPVAPTSTPVVPPPAG